MDLSTFSLPLWKKVFEKIYKERELLFPNFQMETVEQGFDRVRILLANAGTAKVLTPGTAPDLAGTSLSYRDIIADQPYAYDDSVTSLTELQSSVNGREAWAQAATDTLLGKIDDLILAKLVGFVSAESIPAGQVFTSTAPVANEASAIAAEINSLITSGVGKLQAELGTAGARSRFGILDSHVYNHLVMGDNKQSPSRSDLPFGSLTGYANPVLGTRLLTPGLTNRTKVTAYGGVAEHTVIKCWIVCPSVFGLAVQQLPQIEAEYSAATRATRLCATEYFGISTGHTNQFVELRIKILGDLTV